MYSGTVEPFCESLTDFTLAVIGVVYDDLPTAGEKIPDQLFTSVRDLLAERDGLWSFLS